MTKFEEYKAKFPLEADHLYKMQKRELPDGWDKDIPVFPADAKGVAGRDASAKVLNAMAKSVPWLMGGAADLAPSTKTRLTFDGAGDFGPPALTQQTGGVDSHGQAHPKDQFSYHGRNMHFGIRENGMGACINGMALSKVRPFGAGFFVFTDYMRADDPPQRHHGNPRHPRLHPRLHRRRRRRSDPPAHRTSGEPARHPRPDRPSPRRRQRSRRSMAADDEAQASPRLHRAVTARPSQHWTAPNTPPHRRHPRRLCPGRRRRRQARRCCSWPPAAKCRWRWKPTRQLKKEDIKARVVSMPSWELFEEQDEAYRDSVLPPDVTARVSVEMAGTFGWAKYVGLTGANHRHENLRRHRRR